MPLTDVAVRNAKPADKQYKLNDARSLYLLVRPNGAKLWQMKYTWLKKAKVLSFGPYPNTSLADARKRRDEAKLDLKNAIDPSAKLKTAKVEAKLNSSNTFGALADEFLERKRMEGLAESSINVYSRILKKVAGPTFSHRPIKEITSAEILVFLRSLEKKGQAATANDVRKFMGQVFRQAIVTLRADIDVTAPLVGATAKHKVVSHAAIVKPKPFGKLLADIDRYHGSPVVKAALQLSSLNCLRQSELRLATWSEFDLEEGKWTVPAERMKLRREFVTPLSTQAIAILKELRRLTGNHAFVFSGRSSTKKPIAQMAMFYALGAMGYNYELHTQHGFRSSFTTLANENEIARWDVIEAHVDHRDKNTTRAIYNRASYWEERVRLAQDWADYCDRLKAEAQKEAGH